MGTGFFASLIIYMFTQRYGSCDDSVLFNLTTDLDSDSYVDDSRPWCPPSRDIYPCTCDGPSSFLVLSCDRIENEYVISRVSRSTDGIRNFGKFSLTNSRLVSLESNVLGYLRFEYIYARKNTIRRIESVFFQSSWDSLKRIEIVHNDVEKFPFKELASYPKLEVIDLRYNSIKKIPDEAFGKVNNGKLKKVDLSFNKINYVGSNAFRYLTNLQLIDLRYNRLTVLNNHAFSAVQMNHRLTLDLSKNKVMFASEGSFENQLFKVLNLSENNLGKLSEKVFRNLLKNMGDRQTGIIHVNHNRFLCTCENAEWIVRLPSIYKSRIVGLHCTDKGNKKIQDLSLYDINCQADARG